MAGLAGGVEEAGGGATPRAPDRPANMEERMSSCRPALWLVRLLPLPLPGARVCAGTGLGLGRGMAGGGALDEGGGSEAVGTRKLSRRNEPRGACCFALGWRPGRFFGGT